MHEKCAFEKNGFKVLGGIRDVGGVYGGWVRGWGGGVDMENSENFRENSRKFSGNFRKNLGDPKTGK